MTDEEVRKWAHSLIGCCDGQNNARDAQDKIDHLSLEQCAILDDIAFLCVCGWWCSMEEANESPNGEWWCDDCQAEEDE